MKFGLDVHCDADISTAIEQAEHAERLGYDFREALPVRPRDRAAAAIRAAPDLGRRVGRGRDPTRRPARRRLGARPDRRLRRAPQVPRDLPRRTRRAGQARGRRVPVRPRTVLRADARGGGRARRPGDPPVLRGHLPAVAAPVPRRGGAAHELRGARPQPLHRRRPRRVRAGRGRAAGHGRRPAGLPHGAARREQGRRPRLDGAVRRTGRPPPTEGNA